MPLFIYFNRAKSPETCFIVADNAFSGLLAGLNGMLKSIGAISLSPEMHCRFCGVLQFHFLVMSFWKFCITIPSVFLCFQDHSFLLFWENNSCKCAVYLEPGQSHHSGCVKAMRADIARSKNRIQNVRKLSCMFAISNRAALLRKQCPLVKRVSFLWILFQCLSNLKLNKSNFNFVCYCLF